MLNVLAVTPEIIGDYMLFAEKLSARWVPVSKLEEMVLRIEFWFGSNDKIIDQKITYFEDVGKFYYVKR